MTGDIEPCSICRDPMDGSQPDHLLRCNHRFHVECIIDSLRKNRECPVCRDIGFDGEAHNWNHYDTYEFDIELTNDVFSASDELFKMIKAIARMPENKQVGSELKQVKNRLDILQKDLDNTYENERCKILRKLGNSPILQEIRDEKKQKTVLSNKLRNAIKNQFKDMGYELDEKINQVITNYVNKSPHHCRYKWHKYRRNQFYAEIQKYTLPRYAYLDNHDVGVLNDRLGVNPVNNTKIQMVI